LLKPLALHISERKNNEENIFGPPKENRKKVLIEIKIITKQAVCIFPSKFLITFAPKNIQEKKSLHLKQDYFFSRKERLIFFQKKILRGTWKLRFFRQNFLKNQLSWIFLTCIPSSIAKPNRICTHKKIHLDFAYYSKNCNVYLEKKNHSIFSRIFNHIG